MSETKPVQPLAQHTAAAASAGFNYQFERALLWLAKSKNGTRVGIETLDDVTVSSDEGTLILEQNKFSTQEGGKTFSDRSPNLLNTIAIWLDAACAGEIDIANTAFFLVTNKKCTTSLAHEMSAAVDKGSADKCRLLLLAAIHNPSETIAPYVTKIIVPERQTILTELIMKIKLDDGSDDIQKEVLSVLPIPSRVDQHKQIIFENILGWLHTQVMESWCLKRPAWVDRKSFINCVYEVVDSLVRQGRRERMAHLIQLDPQEISKKKSSMFVDQIQLVSDDESEVVDAISDFLKCTSEKLRLSSEGEIIDEAWVDFESNLQQRWSDISRRGIRMAGTLPEKDVGYNIMSEVLDFRGNLAGIQTDQPYLTKGTYHRLSDELKVGWHPQYKALLST